MVIANFIHLYNIIPHLYQEYMCCYFKWWEDGKVGSGSFILLFGCGETEGGYHLFPFFFFFLLLLLIALSWLVRDSYCVFHCSFFALFVTGPFIYALLVHKNCFVCFIKLQKSGFWSLLYEFPWKRDLVLISITV